VFSKSKIFTFLKRDCGTIPVAPFTAQIESGAVNYTAGFIVRSVAKRFSCKNCLSTFSQKDCDGRDNAFIRNKKYDQINASLLIPTAEFSNVVHYVLGCDMSIIINLFEFQLPMCYLNPEFLNF
jgi:hypothetical protein